MLKLGCTHTSNNSIAQQSSTMPQLQCDNGCSENDSSCKSTFIENKQRGGGNTTISSCESALQRSEFLDPLVRINKMKFLTSADIRIASEMRFACLDIRMKKVPSLLEIFDANNTLLMQE